MTIYIDLNDYSGGLHWLSAMGKVDREAIRAKYRMKHIAALKAARVSRCVLRRERGLKQSSHASGVLGDTDAR
jgi:hypothetical protein